MNWRTDQIELIALATGLVILLVSLSVLAFGIFVGIDIGRQERITLTVMGDETTEERPPAATRPAFHQETPASVPTVAGMATNPPSIPSPTDTRPASATPTETATARPIQTPTEARATPASTPAPTQTQAPTVTNESSGTQSPTVTPESEATSEPTATSDAYPAPGDTATPTATPEAYP